MDITLHNNVLATPAVRAEIASGTALPPDANKLIASVFRVLCVRGSFV
jgi:hypothetical protein